jgi:hypothetical protein
MALKNVFGDLALDATAAKVSYVLDTLVAIASAIEPSTGRIRTQVDTSTQITVANAVNVGGLAANSVVLDTMHTTWATTVRPRIS